jgi:hypothetical protein
MVTVLPDPEFGETDNHELLGFALHGDWLVWTTAVSEPPSRPGDHDSGVTDSVGSAVCVTVNVAGSAVPAAKVTVPVRVVVPSFAATVTTVEPSDDEAGETDNQEAEDVADQAPWFVVT